jgi:hypothetical protein
MIEWLDKHFVEGWRDAWRWASVRGAGVFGAIVAALAAQPDLLLGIINFMPAEPIERAGMAIGVGLVAFFGPTILRLWDQEKSDGGAE